MTDIGDPAQSSQDPVQPSQDPWGGPLSQDPYDYGPLSLSVGLDTSSFSHYTQLGNWPQPVSPEPNLGTRIWNELLLPQNTPNIALPDLSTHASSSSNPTLVITEDNFEHILTQRQIAEYECANSSDSSDYDYNSGWR